MLYTAITRAKFQSTLLQEERQQIRQTASDGKNFNPRSYKRSDARCIRSIWSKQIFQSTLLQEERPNPHLFVTIEKNFNPRSYKRSDKILSSGRQWSFYFNPRSYKRSDYFLLRLSNSGSVFQSTLLQEERPSFSSGAYPPSEFQSTLLQEERLQGI